MVLMPHKLLLIKPLLMLWRKPLLLTKLPRKLLRRKSLMTML